MNRTFIATILAALALPAAAAEGVDLSVRSRDQAAQMQAGTRNAEAPFKSGRDPLPAILMREEQESRMGPRGACEATTSDFCYDLANGRVVYRRARQYMPEIGGLRAESISVKRDRVIFKYSF